MLKIGYQIFPLLLFLTQNAKIVKFMKDSWRITGQFNQNLTQQLIV